MSLAMLLELIRRDRGLDLEPYKPTFLERRLAIRMYARQCPDYPSYAELLQRDPSEYEPLLNALRIQVTRFFRDESTFDSLRMKILPALLQARAGPRSLRLWCAGGSSGEEPYSLAILICSLLGPDLPGWNLVFDATDIDPRAIEKARQGVYPAHTFKGLAPVYLDLVERYLTPVGTHRQATPLLRSIVNFKVHDLTREPCPADIDLLLCRNVLIYFDRSEQERLYQSFYQAIRQPGYLVLGSSEILPINWARRFIPAVAREHIYQRAK
jgi:chemotaxis methyl-accepting protein methylase